MKSLISTIMVLSVFGLAMGGFALAQDPSEETRVEAFAETPEPAVSTPRSVPALPPPVEVTESVPAEPAAKDFVSATDELMKVVKEIQAALKAKQAVLPVEPAAIKDDVSVVNELIKATQAVDELIGKIEATQAVPAEPAAKDDVSVVNELKDIIEAKQEAMQAVQAVLPVEPVSPYVATSVAGGRTAGGKVLVIFTSGFYDENSIVSIRQDMYVMSCILDRKFSKGSRLIRGVFTDYGDFFGRDNRPTEAIYLQGYGVLFSMEASFPLTTPRKVQEKGPTKTEEGVDLLWQKTKQEIFPHRGPNVSNLDEKLEKKQYAEKVEEVKKELIKSLKHAANIRILQPDEWVLLMVTGEGRQSTEVTLYENSSMMALSSYSTPGGIAYNEDSLGLMGYPLAMTITIRAKKADVDAFAKGELDFDKFREKVQIFSYRYRIWGQQVGRGHRVIRQPAEPALVPKSMNR